MAKPQIKTGYYKSGGKKFRQYAVSFNDSKNVVLVIDNYFGLLEDRQQNTFANMCYEVASTLRKNRTFVYTETQGMDSKDLLKMIKQINPSAIMFADATAFGQTSLDKSEYFSYVRDWNGIPTILTTPMNLWLDEKQYNKGEGNKALIGFNLKHLLAVTSGENPFDIDLELLGIKPKLIRDIDAFNTLMDRLETQDVICTDIEGKNLKVITNKIFTIQIGFWHKGKILSYVIPWEHRDHSWSKSDFRVVKRRLRQLFMREDLENVFHFGQFDTGHLCNELGMKMFGNKVYDIPSGEFALDENYKYAQKVYRGGNWESDGFKPYSLEFVEYRYGIFRPSDMTIGKSDRANMSKFSLDEIAEYGGFDIVSPLLIRQAQLQICTGKYFGHKSVDNYKTLVIHQLGVMVKTFAFLRNTGIYIDTKNAYSLVSKGNIFTETANNIRNMILETDAGKKANNLIMKSMGLSTGSGGGLFSSQQTAALSLTKPSHLRTLFYDVLKLEPTKVGKTGDPSTDKSFQTKYKKTVPEVKLFSDFNKVKILKSTFADGIIKIIKHDSDFKLDGRLRPLLGFLYVLTGRLSSTDPNCITEDTTILTKRGYVKVTDITTEDYVWTHRRRWRKVMNSVNKGLSPCVKLTLSNGKELKCTLDHKLLTVDGWKHVRDIKIGEDFGGINYLSYQKERQKSSEIVSERITSNVSENSKTFGCELSDNYSHSKRIHAREGVCSTQETSVLEIEVRREEPTERKIRERQPNLHWGLLGSQRLLDKTSVGKRQTEESICTQRHNGESSGSRVTAENIRRAPHRREHVEQLLRQLSISDSKRTQTDAHGPSISDYVFVTKIEEIGKHTVWDIAVEEDQSYFSADIVSHNSQNIPTRSDESFEIHEGMVKAIKKSFSVKHGRLMLGSDFSAHEVRMAGVISKDPEIRKSFLTANEAIRKFRLTPEKFVEAAAKVLDQKGDIHIINVKFFFNQDVDKKHPLRYRIKAIVFGTLYGKLAKSLSKDLGISEAEAKALIDVMFERWHCLKDWIDDTQRESRENFMVRYPNFRVAHMWANLHDDIWAQRAMDRRSVNYPIQGFSSDIGVVSVYCYKYWVHHNIIRNKLALDAHHVNIVHDAQYSDVLYEHMPMAIYLTEHSMSTLPMDYYKKHFNVDISIPLSYGLEFGKNWSALNDWNFRVEGYNYADKDNKQKYAAGLLDMLRDEGKDMNKPYDKVIKDTKFIMDIRRQELERNPYKMLVNKKTIDNVFKNMHMFREQEAA